MVIMKRVFGRMEKNYDFLLNVYLIVFFINTKKQSNYFKIFRSSLLKPTAHIILHQDHFLPHAARIYS